MFVYIGTYSKGGSKGIYVYQLDAATGQLRDTGHTAPTQNPSFVALHPGGGYLYAVSEVERSGDVAGGAVSAFAIDARTGGLTFLNQQSSRGAGPCHLSVDASGRVLLVANYGGGSIAALPIAEGGRLGKATAFFQHQGSSVHPQRQQEAHAHSITPDAAGRFALACDLGLDKIFTYQIGATPNPHPLGSAKAQLASQVLEQVLACSTRPGAGPRHFAFHPSSRFGYAINELDSTITAYSYQPDRGELEEIHRLSTVPADFAGPNSTADIHVAPSGRFLYGSNRGHDSLAIYAIDEETGRLNLIGHEPTQGQTPRGFAVDPTGSVLLAANQDSDSVVVFRIDAQTGRLAATGQSIAVPSPVCLKVRPL